ncbi:HAD family hydrolase [Herbidospora yilanensis]|uniref:HAD family hydrolase n=1 Tax=Herbidospora yilanensis TaxID=354426 RepID=UPI00078430F4|nr:HAD hydrolase-like protein [Herbidospora yilanensis]
MGINVGFDLDLTLADTRAAIAAVYEALVPSLSTPIDIDVAVSRIGWPLEDELAQWLPVDEIPAAVALYRSLYPGIALPATVAMPGAHEALAAVRAVGGRIIVVTGKNPRDARRTVDALGLDVDDVAGSVFGADKGAAIAAFGAAVYVGDHVADVEAARAGGAISVAVATGGCTPAQLAERGADVVVGDLTEFVSWYATRTSIPA